MFKGCFIVFMIFLVYDMSDRSENIIRGDDTVNICLGENIKKLRRERNLTQDALSEFLGVSFQTISNWERGESYPDITMLPEIAEFFKVSVDELLGVNREADERELKRLLKEHDNFTDNKLIKESIYYLKDKYPNDFRVQLRYMSYLIYFDDATQNTKKIESLYQNIQNNCTKDYIRICAKRFYIHYLELLARDENSDITFTDCEEIINEMPRMRDGREMFFNCYPENHPKKDALIQEAIEEEIFLLDNTISRYLYDDRYSSEYKIALTEKATEFFSFIYDDGNYGRMWRFMLYNYGHLGMHYYRAGNKEKALESFNKMCDLAIKFDAMDRVTVMRSVMFEGKEFDKQTLGTTYVARMQIKELLTDKYPLSDEFRSRKDFKKMIERLGV